MDWRLYTALWYLKKGNYEAFYDLLLIKKTEDVDTSEDLKYLVDNNYIKWKKQDLIIILPNTDELLNKKNKQKIEVDKEYLDDFLKGFPAARQGDNEQVIRELELFLNNYDYTKEEILKAKDEYIKEESAKNFMYVNNADNFIIKKLGNYCRYIKLKKNMNESGTNNNTVLM